MTDPRPESPARVRSRPGQFWKEPWLTPRESLRIRRLNTTFLAQFLAGSLLLASGAVALPGTWTLNLDAVLSLVLLGAGVLLLIGSVSTNVRMRTESAILAEAHRRALDGAAGTRPTSGAPAPTSVPLLAEVVVVDLAPFWLTSSDELRRVKPKITLIMLLALALGGFLLFQAFTSVRSGDEGSAVEFGILGTLLLAIGALFALALYRPNAVNRPVRIEIGPSGIRVSKTRGPPSEAAWTAPGLMLFLIDTRPSVRRPSSPGSPVLSVYSRSLGRAPITVDGAEALRVRARQQGFHLVELPQGTYGALPLRVRADLPFGSIVSVMSRE